MNEVIRIQDHNGKKAVSAKELYEKLGLEPTHWSTWSRRNITKNNFAIENTDYQIFRTQGEIGRPTHDYVLTLDFAKKLCMLARTSKGEEIRNYFLEMEKVAISQKPTLTPAEALLQSVQMIVEQEKRVNLLEKRVDKIEAGTQLTRPNYFTILGYATINNLQVGFNIAKRLGQKAAKMCRESGFPMDEVPDPRFGRVRSYPATVLQRVFADPVW